VLVVNRFRVPGAEALAFRLEAEAAHALLATQRGYVEGRVGRSVDDPELWVLQTVWAGPGAYRRALSSNDVKAQAWTLLSRAIDEPSAYETVVPGEQLNDVRPRELG
jgi:heme-degrading monooxygenase HmoA